MDTHDDYVFEARSISRSFGTVQALADVTIGIRRGEIHSVVGENGAGKSTLMNILCGRLPPSSGALYRSSTLVTFASPTEARAAGIGIAPQEVSLAPKLTVAENIALGAHAGRGGIVDWKTTRRHAAACLHAIDDSIDPAERVERLGKAQQQLVQIARALAGNVEVLIFDEPTAALTDRETVRLKSFMAGFRNKGGSIFYISHRLEEVLEVSDRISVFRDGRLVARLDPATTSKVNLVDLMAGRAVTTTHRPRSLDEHASPVLEVEGLTRHGEFADIGFCLHRGEILGIAGLIGAGRTELAKCIFGATRPDRGTMRLFGEALAGSDPARSIASGLVYVSEERKAEAIFPLLTIAENMALPSHAKLSGRMGIDFARVAREVDALIDRLGIKVGDQTDPITSLSGGNQQKVVLARWLMRDVRVLILDEPTRGIDVRAKFEIQRMLNALCDAGLSIIYISSDLLEVLEIADRILVMHEGRAKGVQRADQATPETLLQQAMA